jgi:hypothetical protein
MNAGMYDSLFNMCLLVVFRSGTNIDSVILLVY